MTERFNFSESSLKSKILKDGKEVSLDAKKYAMKSMQKNNPNKSALMSAGNSQKFSMAETFKSSEFVTE